MTESTLQTHILVALPCEAKPLISHFRLKRKMDDEAFHTYQRENLSLTVSGVGKIAMAAAVVYTKMTFPGQHPRLWLNVGVAGHPTYPLGKAVIANKIIDDDSGRCWYPPLTYHLPCESDSLQTVSRPDLSYSTDTLYDMEASGFYQTAIRFSSAELVQSIKIISDNRQSPTRNVTAEQVSRLIIEQTEPIEQLLERLEPLAARLHREEPPMLASFLQQWRFSAQQQRQLKALLHRWALLLPDDPPVISDYATIKERNVLLKRLKARLDELPVLLYKSS